MPALSPCSNSHTKPPRIPLSLTLFSTQISKHPILSPPCEDKPFPVLVPKKAYASENPTFQPFSKRQCSKFVPGDVWSQYDTCAETVARMSESRWELALFSRSEISEGERERLKGAVMAPDEVQATKPHSPPGSQS